MVTAGFWRRFQDLIAGPVRQVGVVVSNNGNGLYTVALPSGDGLQVLGLVTYTAGQSVFIRDGKIEGVASALAAVNISI